MQHAMTVMGLSPQIQQYSQMIVSGVLHLGNIDFVERNNYAEIANKQCQFFCGCLFSLCKSFKIMSFLLTMRSSQ